MTSVATHSAPVWGAKADFIIRADLATCGMPGRYEQLWARKLNEFSFEVCCIPFFTYGIALGDTVESTPDYTIARVTERKGHKTLRVAIIDEHKQDACHELLHAWVDTTGLRCEWHAPGYVAVDLPPDWPSPVNMSTLELLKARGDLCVEVDD